MSTFTLYDAVKIEDLNQINYAGYLIIISSLYGLKKINKNISYSTKITFFLQILLVILMLITTNKSVTSLQKREGLPYSAQISGWTLLVISLFVTPFLHYLSANNHYKVRLLAIFLTFALTLLLTTSSYFHTEEPETQQG